MSLLVKARQIARDAHEGQFRRDGITPYIEHPKAVAARLHEENESVQAIAWLHDVLEDTDESPDSLIEKGIPSELVDVLELLTHAKHELYADYLERIKSNPLAVKVKIADMLTNLSDTPTERQILKYARGLQTLLDH